MSYNIKMSTFLDTNYTWIGIQNRIVYSVICYILTNPESDVGILHPVLGI